MYAEGHPDHSQQPKNQRLHHVLRVAEGSLGWALVIVAICAGVGWLYLLRDARVLNVGPHMRAALPLEELASRGAQPLLRMAVAWLPAGFAAGLALGLTTRLRAALIPVATGLLSFVVLFLTTAASEAVSRNERLTQHLSPVLSKGGLWSAVAFVIMGSLLAALLASRARARREPASRTPAGTSSSAA